MDGLEHTTRPGSTGARCGALGGPVTAWEQVNDPDHPATFTCPACLADVNRGGAVTKMGGL